MTTDELKRKLECALEREQEKQARAIDKLDRARTNREAAERHINASQREIAYYKDRINDLRNVAIAGANLP